MKVTLRRQRGFSLSELLIVIAIMSVLSALAMSSVSSLRSTSLTSAGNTIVDVFGMARQNSVGKGCYTAVLIRTQGTGALGSYCLLQLVRQDDGSFSAGWTQLTPWKYLPKGVVFENNQPTIDTYLSPTNSQTSTSLPAPLTTLLASFPFQGAPVDLSNSVNVQCYEPDGSLVGGQSLRLRLIEGTADPTAGSSSYTGATSGGTAVSYYDLYFVANTGVTKVARN